MISAMDTPGKAKVTRPWEVDMIDDLMRWRSGVTVLGGHRRVKGKAGHLSLLLLAVGVGLAACSQPALVPDVPGAAGPILQEAPGLQVAVEVGAWNARPSSLPDTVLPLLVTLSNTGDRPIIVTRQDFALLDQANRQYSSIHPADVAAMFGGGGGSGVAVSPSVGFGGSSGGWGNRSFVGGGLGFTFGSWGSDIRDIIPLALADGPIQPGAAVRGFLYFPRPAPDSQEVRLVAFFRDLPGTPQMQFRFRRAE
jgi:hypothetical protein